MNKEIDRPSYFFNLMIVVISTVILAIVAIVYNNSIRSVPVFLFILVLGVGILAGAGLARGGIFGLLLVSVWITIKQVIGVWSEDRLFVNLIEILLTAVAFVASGFYHYKLQAHFNEYLSDLQQLKQLDLEDTSLGLLKSSIGLLRLREETDRAMRFRRPLTLVLILSRPIPGKSWETNERSAVLRSAATTIKDTTRTMDIPFLLSQDKIAIILPETEINGTNKVINNIQKQMISAQIVNQSGFSEPLNEHAQIRFGFGVFLGYKRKPFDIMEAAEKSLEKGIESNIGGIFQNLFIDWEIIGEPIMTKNILSHTPKKEPAIPSPANNDRAIDDESVIA